MRCGNRPFDQPIRAAVVHHTAESNDYQPQDSAAIVQSIFAYHTQILGWCDIAYNALVDKYGQVFEGRAGALLGPVQGDHTGGFNSDSWGVAMIGNFDDVAPTPIQLHTIGRLIGWRLGMDHVDPRGTVALPSAGGEYTYFPLSAVATLPTIFAHRDVGDTDCPGNVAYGLLDEIRDTAAHFNGPPRPEDLALSLQGGAIYDRWQTIGGPEQRPGRTHLARSDRSRRRALRHLREGRDVLVTGDRPAGGHRSHLRRVGLTRLRARRAGPADQLGNPRAAMG